MSANTPLKQKKYRQRITSYTSRSQYMNASETTSRKCVYINDDRNYDKEGILTPTTCLSSMTINKTMRKDAFGNVITKGRKEHKVSFIDQVINEELVEVLGFTDKANEGWKNKKEAEQINDKIISRRRMNDEDGSRVLCSSACIII